VARSLGALETIVAVAIGPTPVSEASRVRNADGLAKSFYGQRTPSRAVDPDAMARASWNDFGFSNRSR
jgi:hypothetical protein